MGVGATKWVAGINAESMKWLMGSGSLMGFKYKHFLIICFCLLILAGSIYVLLPEIIFLHA